MPIEFPVPNVKLQHPWTLYAKQLFPQGYGYPLWQPDPDPTAAREVDIGDVGWMAYGGFCQLFNARREDREKQVHADVPEDFVPFDPPNLVILGPAESVTAIPPLCSQTVETFDASGSAQATSGPIGVASAGASFSFKCTDNQGAVLMFSPAAYLTEIMSKHHVINYMREHFPRWMEFSDKYGLGLKDHDLFFVCGMTKTARWAVAAFQGDFRRKEGTFFADLGSGGGLNMSVSISNQSLPQTHRKVGPRRPAAANVPLVGTANSESATTDEEPNDQCIFIHYYQMKRRMGLFRTFRAAAGPDELPPPGPDEAELGVLAEGDTNDNDDLEQTMDHMEDTYNPVNHLLDYILQNSDASMAIASDLDLYALFNHQDFPADIPEALVSLRPRVEIDENGVGTVAVQIDFGMRTVGEEISENAQGTVDLDNPLAKDSPVQESESDYNFLGYLRGSAANVFPGTTFDNYVHNMDEPDMFPDPFQFDDDDDATYSDTSDGLVEVSTREIPGYFQERGGRLFHSHARSPYPLPVDQEEHQRQNGLNQLLRRLIGDSSVGPVRDILVDVPGEERRVLDLGTGTGEWVLDMAREFPRVRFYGVDIVPIATRYPPHNVLFEMHDIAEKFRYDSGSIDFVHARSISMAIRDYGAVLPEIARVLCPDGLFVSNEWGRCPIMLDGSDLALHAPSTSEFFRAVRETLHERCGIPTVAHEIPELLQDSGFFTGIVSRRYYMPIGSWHDDPGLRDLGSEHRGMVELYARAMRAVLNEGRWAAKADALINGCIDESWRVPGLVSVYYTVHARRV